MIAGLSLIGPEIDSSLKNALWLEGKFAVKFDEAEPSSSDITPAGNRGRPCKTIRWAIRKITEKKEYGFST